LAILCPNLPSSGIIDMGHHASSRWVLSIIAV
jgi:hypothetical protein